MLTIEEINYNFYLIFFLRYFWPKIVFQLKVTIFSLISCSTQFVEKLLHAWRRLTTKLLWMKLLACFTWTHCKQFRNMAIRYESMVLFNCSNWFITFFLLIQFFAAWVGLTTRQYVPLWTNRAEDGWWFTFCWACLPSSRVCSRARNDCIILKTKSIILLCHRRNLTENV